MTLTMNSKVCIPGKTKGGNNYKNRKKGEKSTKMKN